MTETREFKPGDRVTMTGRYVEAAGWGGDVTPMAVVEADVPGIGSLRYALPASALTPSPDDGEVERLREALKAAQVAIDFAWTEFLNQEEYECAGRLNEASEAVNAALPRQRVGGGTE